MIGSLRFTMGMALALASLCCHAAGVDVDAFVKKDHFGEIKISPTGTYYAATVPFEDHTALVVLDRTKKTVLGKFQLGPDSAIYSFDWVSPERLLIGAAEKFGDLDKPQPTGELFAMDANGGKTELLVGQRVREDLGSNIKTKKAEMVAAFLVDDLPGDDKNVLISASPFAMDAFSRVERMNIYTGQRQVVTRVPVRNARFVTDNHGVVRFALGSDTDNASKLLYRPDDKTDWTLMNSETATDHVEIPLGFSADDRVAYLMVEQQSGPDAIVAYDVASGKRTQIVRDAVLDPERILHRPGTSVPIGAMFGGDKPHLVFFDENSADAKFMRSLQAAFGGDVATVTSSTDDGHFNLVDVWSDRNPGDFYLFDSVSKKADYVISTADWLDPAKMGNVSPITLTARDGLLLKGFLTLPRDSAGKHLPLIMMPHGGPFTISDEWGFDRDAQMLAAAGYAVLQVNYRGSGGRGRAFLHAGERQWGLSMQDDVTDATKWAIQQGIADPQRICIYGASYGAFAALMGAAKEPGLYRCAAGYVGVYDLQRIHAEETSKRGSLKTWANEWIGDDMATLAANSPSKLASRIKVPVLLAAGRADETAHVEHTEDMERALKAAGVPVEAYYYANEGHGFYKPENRKDFYTKLLAFLSRSLGGGVAIAPPAATGSAESAK